ncbi:MAG: hypothetical protein ACI85F_000839 [Bacteroidia bacterium]|jgi:hypothetical protein
MKNISLLLISMIGFSAFAQEACDGIEFQSISYNAFTDTAIIVHVINNGPELFSYPGFILINNVGDTFAMELVNFFGIGQESIHSLEIWPGVMDPTDIFNGVLELHTGFYDSLWCSWPINQSFCPTENCANLVIGMQNWGGALVVGDFEYFLDDTNGNTVETGTYTMVDTIQYWEDTLCVPLGQYNYTVNALGMASGGGPVITVAQFAGLGGPMIFEYLDWYNGATINVPFYLQCESTEPNAIIKPISSETLSIRYTENEVIVGSNSSVSFFEIFDLKGQLITQISSNDSATIISSGLPKGLYVVRARFRSGQSAMNKFIVQ